MRAAVGGKDKTKGAAGKRDAVKKGKPLWDPKKLEVEDIVIPLRCPILDIEIIRNKKEDLKDNSPSLDRIDNAKGYVKGNIMVVSNKANTMKSNASPEQLIKFAQWILKTYDSLL